MNDQQVAELLLQALEHERGGIQIYETAIKCAQNDDLRAEWKHYLAETHEHERVLTRLCKTADVDIKTETPGRAVVRHVGQSLVAAMELALDAGDEAAAELVACECVVLAETKDHFNWQLIGKCADHLDGKLGDAMRAAYDTIEDQEDHHLYHTKGWCRELWLQSLGIAAVLPPPEERLQVSTAIGAARAEQGREQQT